MSPEVLHLSDVHYAVRPNFWSRVKPILEGVTLEVERAEIYGFLGPNGAGKTTTIKTILGLLRPSRGSIRVFEQRAANEVAEKLLGG